MMILSGHGAARLIAVSASIASRMISRELRYGLINSRMSRHTFPLHTWEVRLIAARVTEADTRSSANYELTVHESNSFRPAMEVEVVPRAREGPIASAWLCPSNHIRNEDCSDPGSRC